MRLSGLGMPSILGRAMSSRMTLKSSDDFQKSSDDFSIAPQKPNEIAKSHQTAPKKSADDATDS